MKVVTSRFGSMELMEEDLLQFPEGLLGFGNLRKFVLLDDPNDEIFAWLQSCEEPDVAFPVLEPELFATDYHVDLVKSDLEVLGLDDPMKARSFLIITIPADPTQMTANFKAPVVINVAKRRARQCVLQDNSLAIREPIFARLQQRVVQSPSKALKGHSEDRSVAIRIPDSATRPPMVEG